MPATSRRPPQGAIPAVNAMDTSDWKTSTALHTTHARIDGQPVKVLFDEGSQVNILSTEVVRRLHIQTTRLSQSQLVRFPNNDTSTITDYIPSLTVAFPAIRLSNKLIRLFFHTSLLVMNTRMDMILGVPFLRYWNHFSLLQWFSSRHWAIRPSCDYSAPHHSFYGTMSHPILPCCSS